MESTLVGIKGRRQLFFDDYCIEKVQNLVRQYNKPKKHSANPIFKPEEPWEKHYMLLYGNVIYDPKDKHFQMWYSARWIPGKDDDTDPVAICHATSDDGINWKRTRVDQYKPGTDEYYNAVMTGHYFAPTVFYTPEAEDDKKYRMFVNEPQIKLFKHKNKTLFTGGAFSVYFSPDGLHWNDFEYNPIMQGGDCSTCSYDPVTKEYIAYPRTARYDEGIFRRCVGVAASKDFISWPTSSDILISADRIDDERVVRRLSRFRDILVYDDPSYYSADLYGMTGFRYEDFRLGLLWFQDKSGRIPTEHGGGNEDGIINIQLAYKRCNTADYWHRAEDRSVGGRFQNEPENVEVDDFWHRADDRSNFIECGEPGAFDAGMIFTAHTVVEVGDELLFYYGGCAWSHALDYPDHYRYGKCDAEFGEIGTGIGLATLRRDGFVSMDASYPGGILVTKPIMMEGKSLEINAFAKNGFIKVEVLDEEYKTIKGYGKDDCIPLSADEVHHKVGWKNNASIDKLHGRIIRLAFHMMAAKLYSFSIL